MSRKYCIAPSVQFIACSNSNEFLHLSAVSTSIEQHGCLDKTLNIVRNDLFFSNVILIFNKNKNVITENKTVIGPDSEKRLTSHELGVICYLLKIAN